MNLTEVILTEGKVISRQADFTADHLDFPFGSFPVVKKTPLTLEVENKGNKVLGLKGSIELQVLISVRTLSGGRFSGSSNRV